MSAEEVIEQLDFIYDLIKEEKYEQAMDHIQKKKMEFRTRKNPVSKYLDSLTNELK